MGRASTSTTTTTTTTTTHRVAHRTYTVAAASPAITRSPLVQRGHAHTLGFVRGCSEAVGGFYFVMSAEYLRSYLRAIDETPLEMQLGVTQLTYQDFEAIGA